MKREQIAEKLASMDNWRFADLKEKATSFNEGAPTQSHYLRRADAVLSLLTEDKCPDCDGVGAQSIVGETLVDRWTCPTCHGTGKPVKECPECDGEGCVPSDKTLDIKHGVEWMDCPTCKGEGWLPEGGLLTKEEVRIWDKDLPSYFEEHVFSPEYELETYGLDVAKAQHDKDLIRLNAQDLYVLDDDLKRELENTKPEFQQQVAWLLNYASSLGDYGDPYGKLAVVTENGKVILKTEDDCPWLKPYKREG